MTFDVIRELITSHLNGHDFRKQHKWSLVYKWQLRQTNKDLPQVYFLIKLVYSRTTFQQIPKNGFYTTHSSDFFVKLFLYTSVQVFEIQTWRNGRSYMLVFMSFIFFAILCPVSTWPNTTCFPSNQLVRITGTKNWEEFEFGPENIKKKLVVFT